MTECRQTSLTVYTSEALDDDSSSTEVSRFQGGVFTTASLTVVVFTDHAPLHVLRLKPSRAPSLSIVSLLRTLSTVTMIMNLNQRPVVTFSCRRPLVHSLCLDAINTCVCTCALMIHFNPFSDLLLGRCAVTFHCSNWSFTSIGFLSVLLIQGI